MNLSQKSLLLLLAVYLTLTACSGATNQNKVVAGKTAATTTPTTKTEKAKTVPAQTNTKKPVSNQGVEVNIQDATAKSGAETCVNIVVNQFTDVVSMQYSINWNPAELAYKSVKGFNLKDLSKNNFGAKQAANGKLTFSWYDQAIKGISIADKTAIHQICFDAVGKAGTKSKIQITEDPIIVEITGKGGIFLKLFTETAYLEIK